MNKVSLFNSDINKDGVIEWEDFEIAIEVRV